MASARDIVPIALAGLASALGGQQVARGIGNAAQISRQGRIDKQRSEQLDVANAKSARQLELAEESAERSERSLRTAESRETRYADAEKERLKKDRQTTARLSQFKSSWLEGHPDSLPEYRDLIDAAENTSQARIAAQQIAQWEGSKTPEEAQAAAEGLKPGQSLSFRMDDGSQFTARGLAEGSGSQIPSWKINDKIHDGQREYDKAVSDARMELARYQDKTDSILESQEGDGSREAHERLSEQVRLKSVYEDLIRPGSEWKFIQGSVGGLGIGDTGMSQLRQSYEEMQQAEAEAANTPPGQTGGDPAVNAAYDEIFGQGQAPPLQTGHTPGGNVFADTGLPVQAEPVERQTVRTLTRGR